MGGDISMGYWDLFVLGSFIVRVKHTSGKILFENFECATKSAGEVARNI
jgi:hypothetical protein